MANSFKVESYRSAKSLSFIVIGLLAVQLGCYALYIILSAVQVAMPDMALDAADPGLTVPLVFIGLLSFVEIITRLATIVFFLIWLHRAYANLSPLKARGLEYTPGWAVGWWFIPFANLVKPYQIVTEAWRESDPGYDEDLGYLTSSIENPWVFPVWWGAFIIGGIVSRILEKLPDTASGNVPESFYILLIPASIFMGTAAILAIWIVRDTTVRQDSRWSRVASAANNVLPPPPPTFG